MKAERLRQEIKYDTPEKNYIKSKMYMFDFSTDIMVVEEQAQDGSKDQTILHYKLKEKEQAYFSEEYLPNGMKKEGQKKPDITAIVEASNNRKAKWFIGDMKDTVINVKTAGKLCGQWHKGIEHLKDEYLKTKAEYQIENSVGVITRYWDKDKLQEDIEEYRKRLGNKNELLSARKSLTKVNEYAEWIRSAENIIAGVYDDYDEDTGEWIQYRIQYIDLVKEADLLYVAHMDIRL